MRPARVPGQRSSRRYGRSQRWIGAVPGLLDQREPEPAQRVGVTMEVRGPLRLVRV